MLLYDQKIGIECVMSSPFKLIFLTRYEKIEYIQQTASYNMFSVVVI